MLLTNLRESGRPNSGVGVGGVCLETLRVLGQVVVVMEEEEEHLDGRCGRKQRKGRSASVRERREISRNGDGAAEFPKGCYVERNRLSINMYCLNHSENNIQYQNSTYSIV